MGRRRKARKRERQAALIRLQEASLIDDVEYGDSFRAAPKPSPEEAESWLWYNKRQREVAELERVRRDRALALALA